MSAFSPWQAAVFGLEALRREPFKLGLWLAAFAAVNILYLRDYAAAAGPFFAAQIAGDPDAMVAAFAPMFRIYLWFPLQLALMIAIQGLILRSLLTGRPGGWAAGLQFGLDELRLLVVNIAVYAISIGAYLVAYIAALVVFLLLSVIAAAGFAVVAGWEAEPGAAVWVALGVALLMGLAVFALVMGITAYPALKLTMAAAASVAERRIQVFGVWGLTPRWPWRLLGGYLVLWLAWLPVIGGVALLTFLAGGGMEFDLQQTGRIFTSPAGLAAALVYGASTALILCLWAGIGAYTYLVYGPDRPADDGPLLRV